MAATPFLPLARILPPDGTSISSALLFPNSSDLLRRLLPPVTKASTATLSRSMIPSAPWSPIFPVANSRSSATASAKQLESKSTRNRCCCLTSKLLWMFPWERRFCSSILAIASALPSARAATQKSSASSLPAPFSSRATARSVGQSKAPPRVEAQILGNFSRSLSYYMLRPSKGVCPRNRQIWEEVDDGVLQESAQTGPAQARPRPHVHGHHTHYAGRRCRRQHRCFQRPGGCSSQAFALPQTRGTGRRLAYRARHPDQGAEHVAVQLPHLP